MILYLNGDSHTAGGEAIHPYCFAIDDSKYWFLQGDERYYGHPDNLNVCYGKLIADSLGCNMVNHASSAASNFKILRTTYNYLENNKPDLIIIGWSSWEREEWYNEEDGEYYQVNASGADSVPKKWRDRYKQFVLTHQDTIGDKVIKTHKNIYNLHLHLNNLGIPHLFFNCFTSFYGYNDIPKLNWGDSYIKPYSQFSYTDYLKSHGCIPSKHLHFGPDGHAKWAEFLLPHLTRLL